MPRRLNEKQNRAWVACGLAAAFIAVSALGRANAATIETFIEQTRVGEPLVLRFGGKPKMGYFWRLNAENSSGLGLVEIDRLGWSFSATPRGSASFTKPGTLRYAVKPKKAGAVLLVFEYFRKEPGASASARRTYRIEILPASPSGR